MSANEHITIAKNAILPPAQDYYVLRAKGVDLIERLGSKLWTDYNIHDPGITILEVLCYAITDLANRAAYPITDLLAEPRPATFNPDDQTFFSARQILATAPWTINDYRKLLIDHEGIKNAWVKRNTDPYLPAIYADCKNDTLTYDLPDPTEDEQQHRVTPKGLYSVLLELDEDEKNGDLNMGKIQFSCTVPFIEPETVFGEARTPALYEILPDDVDKILQLATLDLTAVRVHNISTTKGGPNLNNERLPNALRGLIHANLDVDFTDSHGQTITANMDDIPIRFVMMPDRVRQNMDLGLLRAVLRDIFPTAIFAPFTQRLAKAREMLDIARKTLQSHRNLTEDFCEVQLVRIEEMGICTDLEITPETDIEQVMGEVYYQIAEYFNPAIRFHTLAGMLDKTTVDQIYDGPSLTHGFIDDADLDKSGLNRTLYASDIINLLMDIPGITAVKNFMLVRFDSQGNRTETQAWQMPVSPNCLPRLYIEGSKVLLFKNGLPFVPDTFELMDTLHVVNGRNGMPKLKEHDPDLPVPQGTAYDLAEYVPVQNSLPLTYGVGPAGLPSTADDLRRAQAQQLKGYLFFFEQLLANYLGQLGQLKQLFSLSNSTQKTYFPTWLDSTQITGLSDLYDSLDELSLYEITESENEFQNRRNRFLDHLLARFSESFSDFALLLYSSETQKKINAETLIHTKTSFLKQYPYQSAYKAQSFDQTLTGDTVVLTKDLSGVHQRISSLLGLNPSANFFRYDIQSGDTDYSSRLTLHDTDGSLLMTATSDFRHENRDDTIRELNFVMGAVSRFGGQADAYNIVEENSRFKPQLGNGLAVGNGFATQAEAEQERDRLIAFAVENLSDERFMIVEHILLRPKQAGDALLEVCIPTDCNFCGNEDPYSFRVTFVFNGESTRAKTNFEFRRFAEKTIRAELPAHVLAKICWVKKDTYHSFEEAYTNWITEPDKSIRLATLVDIFTNLRSIYPPPTLHDCVDGNDDSRVFLNQTQL